MEFKDYKKEIIKVAKQLWYDNNVIDALRRAKTEIECTLIMRTARERSFED